MKTTQLSLRTNSLSADDHHIWNNNGTWWCHYTIHKADYTKQRIRVSLGTRDRDVARQRRDQLLGGVAKIADAVTQAIPTVEGPAKNISLRLINRRRLGTRVSAARG
jgi:hypothetical protein